MERICERHLACVRRESASTCDATCRHCGEPPISECLTRMSFCNRRTTAKHGKLDYATHMFAAPGDDCNGIGPNLHLWNSSVVNGLDVAHNLGATLVHGGDEGRRTSVLYAVGGQFRVPGSDGPVRHVDLRRDGICAQPRDLLQQSAVRHQFQACLQLISDPALFLACDCRSA